MLQIIIKKKQKIREKKVQIEIIEWDRIICNWIVFHHLKLMYFISSTFGSKAEMNGGCPVMETLIFPAFNICTVNGITSVGDRKFFTRIVLSGWLWRWRRISLNVFPPAPSTTIIVYALNHQFGIKLSKYYSHRFHKLAKIWFDRWAIAKCAHLLLPIQIV